MPPTVSLSVFEAPGRFLQENKRTSIGNLSCNLEEIVVANISVGCRHIEYVEPARAF